MAAPVTDGKWCSLHLHWAGGAGQPDVLDGGGYWKLWPSSPDGALWWYDGAPDAQDEGDAAYERIVTFLGDYLDTNDCGPVMVLGYSNGGGLAAKLLCRGEDFGGRLWAFIIDDPVMDGGVDGCNPSPNIREVRFTHSEELIEEAAATGGDCDVIGWYCEDGRTMTIDEYQELTGYASTASRELHGGGGWEDLDLASWHLEYVLWTTRLAP